MDFTFLSGDNLFQTIFWILLFAVFIFFAFKVIKFYSRKEKIINDSNLPVNEKVFDKKSKLSEKEYIFNIADTLNHKALVSKTISGYKTEFGEVTVIINNETHKLEAKAANEKKIYAGTDVVITRIENQTVFVQNI